MIEAWLLRTTVDVTLLIAAILLVRPLVRRALGASAAYWLWFLPLLRLVVIDRPERPPALFDLPSTPALRVETLVAATDGLAPHGMLAACWLGGMLAWSVIRVVGWARFRRALAIQSQRIALPGHLSAARGASGANVQFYLTDAPDAPFVTGLARPRIYLPNDFFQLFSPEQQRFVVRHELAHWRRLDLWVRSAWEVPRAALWFNPLVHVGALALRVDQELACDQSILGNCDDRERYRYGQALLMGASDGRRLLGAPSFWVAQKERIAMVARHRKSFARNLVGLVLVSAIGALAFTEAPQLAAQSPAVQPVNAGTPQPLAQVMPTQPATSTAPPRAPVATRAEVTRMIEERLAVARGIWGASLSGTDRGVAIRARAEANTRVSELMRSLNQAGLPVDVVNVQATDTGVEFHMFIYSSLSDNPSP